MRSFCILLAEPVLFLHAVHVAATGLLGVVVFAIIVAADCVIGERGRIVKD